MNEKRNATNVYLDDDIKEAVVKWAKRNRLSMSAAINIMCTSDKHVIVSGESAADRAAV